MKFKEPIEDQPIRDIETNRIFENLDWFCLWYEIPYYECLDILKEKNGQKSISIYGHAIEPADANHGNRKRVQIINQSDGAIFEYDSLYEAAVKNHIKEESLRSAMNGKGPWGKNLIVKYI